MYNFFRRLVKKKKYEEKELLQLFQTKNYSNFVNFFDFYLSLPFIPLLFYCYSKKKKRNFNFKLQTVRFNFAAPSIYSETKRHFSPSPAKKNSRKETYRIGDRAGTIASETPAIEHK